MNFNNGGGGVGALTKIPGGGGAGALTKIPGGGGVGALTKFFREILKISINFY